MLKMMQVMQAMNDSGSQGPPPNNCENPCDPPPPPNHGTHYDFPPQPGCSAPPPPPDYEPRQEYGQNFKKNCTQQGQNPGNSRVQQASMHKDLYSSVMDILNSWHSCLYLGKIFRFMFSTQPEASPLTVYWGVSSCFAFFTQPEASPLTTDWGKSSDFTFFIQFHN